MGVDQLSADVNVPTAINGWYVDATTGNLPYKGDDSEKGVG
jgi:hypothetical protein